MPGDPKAAESNPDPRGIRFIGRYALLGRLASGGMATVHVGRLLGPVGFTRMVAIKRLHPEYARDPAFVSMFLDEARLAARISHPNVVSTLDVVATGGELFLVMEYIHGQSLSWLVKRQSKAGQRIPIRIVASIMSGCLQGLHAAHEARDERGVPLNIVHRDVSPQNVMVGADGLARVLDFGVAKAVGRIQNTREGHIKGKLAYMPPEQIQTDTVSRQADVYAGAVVLWEALTGMRLFKGETEAGTLGKILSGRVPPPSEIVREVPAALDAVVMKGLARDPAARYTTTRAMALDLERAVHAASIAEVSAWLESVSKKELDDRAARIAAIEMGAGLNDTSSMGHLARALEDAVAAAPEDDTSNSARRPDTLPNPFIPASVAIESLPELEEARPQETEAAIGGDDHRGESASQLSNVSMAMGRASNAPGVPARRQTMRAFGLVFGAAIVGAALWLALGRSFQGAPPAVQAASPAPLRIETPASPVPANPSTTTTAPASSGTGTAAAANVAAPSPASATSASANDDVVLDATTDGGAAVPTEAARAKSAPQQPARRPTRRTPTKPDKPSSPFDNLGGRE